MDHNPNQNQPGGTTFPGYLGSIAGCFDVVNLEEPSIVEIIAKDNSSSVGFAIHPYFVVTRPEYVPFMSSFHIKFTMASMSRKADEVETFRDYSKNVAVIKTYDRLFFTRPELHGLEKHHYTDAALLYALDIVQNWLQLRGRKMQVIGPRWQTAAQLLNSRSPQERMNQIQNHPRVIPRLNELGDECLVNIAEPTRVFIYSPGKGQPGFAINNWFIVTRHSDMTDSYCDPLYIICRLTVGDETKEYHVDRMYRNPKDFVVVIKLQDPISLSKPEPNAFYYRDYTKAGIKYAVGIVRRWLEQKHGCTMQLIAPREVEGSQASGSGSG